MGASRFGSSYNMAKLCKMGRVVVISRGRHAGKKGVIVANFEPSKEKPFRNALVVGISKPPGTIRKGMPKWKVDQKSKVKTFMKVINFTHLIPTRYSVEKEINVKALVPDQIDMSDRSAKADNCEKISRDLMTKFVNKNKSAVGVN